jgi:hypothetical protein
VDGLCDRFATYVGYLVAAGRTGEYTAREPDLVLASADQPLPARFQRQARRLDIRNEALLGHSEVAHMLLAEVLGALLPTSPASDDQVSR